MTEAQEKLLPAPGSEQGELREQDQVAQASAEGTVEAAAAPEGTAAGTVDPNLMIVLPVRNVVLFPGTVFPIAIGRERTIAAAQQALREERPVGVLLQRDPQKEDAGPDDLYEIGTVANILRYVAAPDGGHHLVLQGEERFRVTSFEREQPFLVARIERIGKEAELANSSSQRIEARFLSLKQQALEGLHLLPQVPQELVGAVQQQTEASALTDLVAAYLDVPAPEKQSILSTIDLEQRMDWVARALSRRIEVLRLSNEIGRQTKATFDERQREAVLREQMAAIQRQLGEDDPRAAEVAELKEAIAKAQMPDEAKEIAERELRRYERMPEAAGEAGMVRNYLDWLTTLPWAEPEPAPIDIARAREILDADHHGLKKIKDRIIEFLAVRKLAPGGRAPILCFVGPPGVGKTSLGQSIARAMGRAFVRVSLGGVHDEAEIRGHRRTYLGALPGNIIQAIRKAGSRDCVMMLDEIDKMGRGIQGDPSAAMLEVLDPEQNGTFRDNYLGVPFDLSRVVFIATANMLDTIPGPLRDRMEVIELGGYTEGEKLQIARKYLLARQLAANGVTAEQVTIDDEALGQLIHAYTREAGVRNLERELGRAIRRSAVRIADGSAQQVHINAAMLTELLGPQRFESEVAMRTAMPGVATGLAWTPVGGDILFIEASRSPGSGRLVLTGQLGDVMKESAQAALSIVKNHAQRLGIDPAMFEKNDLHVHVPAGATPKDGPSAGVAMYMALASLLTGRNVRSDTAMTGEISLRGLVLPVGGIREKVVAAAAAGITRVMLPARNRRDFDDIPAEVREKLEFTWLETVDQAVKAGLEAAETAAEATAAEAS